MSRVDVDPVVVALVAAKDSEDSVGPTVIALLSLPDIDEVLVVDDGSSDNTTQAALAAGARVIRLPRNLGKGGAVAEGVAASPQAGVYLLVDADLGATAHSAGDLLAPVLEDRADLTIGVLPSPGRKGGFGVVKRMAAEGIRLATGFRAEAPLSGQRAVRGDLLRSLQLASRFGLETGFTIDAIKAGARVLEVPIAADHRHTGRRLSGFVHRGNQGLDVVRALWERMTSARSRGAVIVAFLILALVGMSWSGNKWQASTLPAEPGTDKVLIFGIPGLQLDDIDTGAMPHLDRLIDEGALAAMTIRSGSSRPDLAEGYATIGAGSRVDFDGQLPAPSHPEGDGLTIENIAELRRLSGHNQPTRLGDLGEALHAHGRRTAVVSAAGPGIAPAGPLGSRVPPAALALVDRSGRIDRASVDPTRLTVQDAAGALGLRADPDAVTRATLDSLAAADVVLVDPGDMTRFEVLQTVMGPDNTPHAARVAAVTNTDAILGRISAEVSPSTRILVVSVVPPGRSWRLTPVVAAGAGVVRGQLHSPSTKRNGLVTVTDLTPTILSAAGVPVPAEMIGQTLRYSTRPSSVEPLVKLDRDAAYRESIYLRVAVGFVLAQALIYAAALRVLARRKRAGSSRYTSARGARLLRAAVVASAAFPVSTFLFRAVPNAAGMGFAGVLALAAIDAAIVAAALRARRHPLAPLAWVMGLTVAVLIVDVATGGRLQSSSILGYSPFTAARFYGLGNSAFAVLAGTTILFSAIHLERAPRWREAMATVAALFAVVLFIHASPTLGNDVGGILTLAPVFAVTLLALSGRKISWKVLAAGAGVTLVVLCGAAAIDLMRPVDARTHLGRVASDLLAARNTLTTTLARKAETNLRVLGATVWTWVVPIVGAFVLGLLGWRLKLAELLPAGSPRRIGVYSAVGAGVLGFLVNDSGIVITALVLVFVGPFLTLIALADGSLSGPPVVLEPGAGGSSGSPTTLSRAPAPASRR